MVTGPGFNNNIRFNGFTPLQKPALNASTGVNNFNPANSIFKNGPTDSVHFSSKANIKPNSELKLDPSFLKGLTGKSSLDAMDSLHSSTARGILFNNFDNFA